MAAFYFVCRAFGDELTAAADRQGRTLGRFPASRTYGGDAFPGCRTWAVQLRGFDSGKPSDDSAEFRIASMACTKP